MTRLITNKLGAINNRFLDDVTWLNATGQSYALTDSEVHVWRIGISRNLKDLQRFEDLLTPEEKLRAGRYKQQKDVYRFIVSRGAQRIILGRYLNIPPARLQFILGENKKPYLLSKQGGALHYNLSHSGDWIVLAVATTAVGADVEFIDPAFQYQDILEDNFSRQEVDYITASAERFFTLWTRKEALLKATGQGLGDHLKVAPALDGAHTLSSVLTGADKNWQLHSFNIAPEYVSTVVFTDAAQRLQFFETEL